MQTSHLWGYLEADENQGNQAYSKHLVNGLLSLNSPLMCLLIAWMCGFGL